MRLQAVLNAVEGLEKRFVHYLEAQGYIRPKKIQKARIARRDYSQADLDTIRGIWRYYQRGISVQRAHELVTRAAADGAYVFFPVPARRWERALALLAHADHVVEASAIYGETDVIAKVEVPDQDSLDELVLKRIQSIEAVESTRTFIGVGGMHWQRDAPTQSAVRSLPSSAAKGP